MHAAHAGYTSSPCFLQSDHYLQSYQSRSALKLVAVKCQLTHINLTTHILKKENYKNSTKKINKNRTR